MSNDYNHDFVLEVAPEPEDPAETVRDLAALMLAITNDPAAASDCHEQVGELLRALPPAVRDTLLSEHYRHGEAVLSYAGKRTRGEILGDPRRAPLQVVKTFGEPGEDWTNKLIFGDNIAVLRALREEKRLGRLKNADGTDGIRVCYVDPPFATQREFANSDGTTAYADKKEGAEFIEFLRERLVLIHDLLADNGTLWLHLDQKKAHYAKVVLDELFGSGCFQREVIWRSASGSAEPGARRPTKVHESILMYTKSATGWLWNETRVPVPPDAEIIERDYGNIDSDGRRWRTIPLKTARGTSKHTYPFAGKTAPKQGWRVDEVEMQRLFDEGRLHIPVNGKLIYKKGYLDEHPGYQLPDLWTDIGWCRRQDKYPTEKPQALLERVIKASSNPGDLVMDCFSGSGSTLLSAERLGRRWVGVDVGKLAIHTATRDLMKVEREDEQPVAPFQVFHGALYDHYQLLSRPFEDWKAFVLALYQCRPSDYLVGGVEFNGNRGPRGAEKVVVYDWTHNNGAVVTDDYIRSLHAVLAPHIKRGLVSVIIPLHLAPTLVADTYTAGGLTVRVLRVPPSASARAAEGGIDGFAELSQPASDKHVNLFIQTEGFDFIIQPVLSRKLSIVKGKPRVTLTKFESDGRRSPKAALPDDGRDDLAMVLIDYDHIDFEAAFDFETVVWAADIAKTTPAWSFNLDESVLDKRVAVTWVDKFGNEMREVIEPAAWKAGV